MTVCGDGFNVLRGWLGRFTVRFISVIDYLDTIFFLWRGGMKWCILSMRWAIWCLRKIGVKTSAIVGEMRKQMILVVICWNISDVILWFETHETHAMYTLRLFSAYLAMVTIGIWNWLPLHGFVNSTEKITFLLFLTDVCAPDWTQKRSRRSWVAMVEVRRKSIVFTGESHQICCRRWFYIWRLIFESRSCSPFLCEAHGAVFLEFSAGLMKKWPGRIRRKTFFKAGWILVFWSMTARFMSLCHFSGLLSTWRFRFCWGFSSDCPIEHLSGLFYGSMVEVGTSDVKKFLFILWRKNRAFFR